MFGILCAVSAVIGKCIGSAKEIVYDYKSKEEAKNNNKMRYYDSNGASRLVENDKQVYDTTIRNGDRVTKDIDGNILINYDYNIRQKCINEINEKLRNENAPVECLGYFYDLYPGKQKDEMIKLIPKRQLVYEGIKNGNRYVREMSRNAKLPTYVYINLKNGDYEFLDERNQFANEWLERKNKHKHEQIIVKNI